MLTCTYLVLKVCLRNLFGVENIFETENAYLLTECLINYYVSFISFAKSVLNCLNGHPNKDVSLMCLNMMLLNEQ